MTHRDPFLILEIDSENPYTDWYYKVLDWRCQPTRASSSVYTTSRAREYQDNQNKETALPFFMAPE